MPNIFELSRLYRRKLFEVDDRAAARLVEEYRKSYQQLQHDLEALLQKIAQRREAGKTIGKSWLGKEERFRNLTAQIEEQMIRFGGQAVDIVSGAQSQALELGLKGARDMVRAEVSTLLGTTWNRVPKEALEHLVGYLTDGSPLADFFDRLGPANSTLAKDVLSKAVTLGQNPRQTSKQMREAFGGNLSKSLTVARTETMRPYRQASIESYRANDDVVDGWIRIETLDDTTCIICISEHGKEYSSKEDFETHPNCRGTMIPKVTGVDRQIQTGPEWFDKQSEEKQREVLGDAKYEAYHKGEIDLPSLVQRTEHPDWGGGRAVRSLENAKAEFKDRESGHALSEIRTTLPIERDLYSSWKSYKSANGEGEVLAAYEAGKGGHFLEGDALKGLAKLDGSDALPSIVSDKEFQELPGPVLYRGMNDVGQAQDLVHGEWFIAKGGSGSGTYFTSGETAKESAQKYASGDIQSIATIEGTRWAGEGVVMEAKLSPNAKTISIEELQPKIKGLHSDYMKETDMEMIHAKGSFTDAGALARLLGYDAITVPTVPGYPSEHYTVLVNRSALIVPESNASKIKALSKTKA